MHKIALILAGGEGKRIGGEKPQKIFLGKPLIFWAIKPYLELKLPIWVSVKNKKQKEKIIKALSPLNIPQESVYFVCDLSTYSHLGPLSGIYSAMKSASKDTLFVVSAVDQPLITKDVIKNLFTLGEIFLNFSIVFKKDSSLEPFPGIYPASLIFQLETFIQKNPKKSLKAFLNYLYRKNFLVISENWNIVDKRGVFFTNINTLEDLKRAEGCFSQQKI